VVEVAHTLDVESGLEDMFDCVTKPTNEAEWNGEVVEAEHHRSNGGGCEIPDQGTILGQAIRNGPHNRHFA